MGNFFDKISSSSKKSTGSKAAPHAQINDVDRTILSLKTQRNKLNDQHKLLEIRIDRHQEVARQLLREGRKDNALLAMKKRKLTENQLTQLSSYIMNLEGMLSNIETSRQQTKLVEALQKGNEALKQLQQQVSLDDVKKLMDDTAEARAYQDELGQLLGQSLSSADDELVAAEMAALEEEGLQEELAAIPKVPQATPLPTKVLQKQPAVAAAAREEEAKEEEAREAPMMAA